MVRFFCILFHASVPIVCVLYSHHWQYPWKLWRSWWKWCQPLCHILSPWHRPILWYIISDGTKRMCEFSKKILSKVPAGTMTLICRILTLLMLTELAFASRISGVSGMTWMVLLSISQAPVYRRWKDKPTHQFTYFQLENVKCSNLTNKLKRTVY